MGFAWLARQALLGTAGNLPGHRRAVRACSALYPVSPDAMA